MNRHPRNRSSGCRVALLPSSDSTSSSIIDNQAAGTINFEAGDTAAFPDSLGHYILDTSPTKNLIWNGMYCSERIADMSVKQWLSLTPADIVAKSLGVFIDVLKKSECEK